jgi:hypothetical protein
VCAPTDPLSLLSQILSFLQPDAVNVMLRREPAHAPVGEGGGDGGGEEGPPPLKAVIVDGEDTDAASGFSAAGTGSTPLTLDGGDVLVNPTARTVTSPAGVVGLYKSNPVVIHSLKAPGFNP